jgi:hypothetical protein
MLIIRRHPLTGKEIRQNVTTPRTAPAVPIDELSPGRALSEDVPETEKLPPEAYTYPVQSFILSRD